jgi:hypothetical protein
MTKKRKDARPEIDRMELRQMLLDSIPKESVRWRRRLRGVGEDLSLRFDDGEEERGFDLIVGADGAWSKTRAFLTDQLLLYAGVVVLGRIIRLPRRDIRISISRSIRGFCIVFRMATLCRRSRLEITA